MDVPLVLVEPVFKFFDLLFVSGLGLLFSFAEFLEVFFYFISVDFFVLLDTLPEEFTDLDSALTAEHLG